MDRNERGWSGLAVDVLTVRDFRAFHDLSIQFGRLNVFLGVNGAGKTSLLQALAICLSRFTSRLATGRAAGLLITDPDVRVDAARAALFLEVGCDGVHYGLGVIRTRRGRKASAIPEFYAVGRPYSGGRPMRALADRFREELAGDNNSSLPVVVYYPVNRAVLNVPLRIRGVHKFDQLAAYEGAFETQRNFRTFFEWFRGREDLENERRVEKSMYRDPQLEAVRSAIEAFMEGYGDLRVRRSPLRMTLTKGRQELQINQLSDGEKVVLSLVGDLARRLAVANPGLDRPLEGQGFALVDEVDLHLHPSWQREIVQKLPAVFPNLQFFLTTHSPIIAGATPSESLFVLEDGSALSAQVYGQDAGLILAELFDTSPRPEKVRAELDALFLAIAQTPDAAAGLLESLEQKLGASDPELVKARILVRGARRP